ncbi:EAL domain-containing response regulator [Sulfurimonas sp.]
MLSDIRLLYVEDDADIAEEIAYFLKRKVKELVVAEDGEAGLSLFKEVHPDIVVTDIQMPKMNGLSMIEKIRELDSQVPIIITSAYNDTNFLTRSIDLSVDGYITKPINLKKMLETIEKSYKPQELLHKLENKNEELVKINENLDAIVHEKTKDLEFLYRHDKLTMLENKVALQEIMDYNSFEYLVLLDIANFSYLNKQYGKTFGDEVLLKISKLLTTHTMSNIKLYKIESDRFVFLVKNIDEITVEEFCRQIHSFFDNKKITVENIDIGIAFNIGVASFDSKEDILVHAEYALDIAKELGARFYSFYAESNLFVQKNKNLIKWLNITKEMIEEGNIIPYFQPILDVETNKIVKFEVLARGLYNDEIITPLHFIEPATKLGLISSVTRIMIQKSFQIFKENDFEFSINISERDLHEGYLCDYLLERTAVYGIKPSRLTLEILENVTVDTKHKDIVTKINKLKALGFKIAIDDFGTENANFSRLMDIDFDYIKLDAVFIKNLDTNEKQQLIVKSIVELAKVLGVKTVAEYVCSESIYKIVKECGVDMVQGYYLGKPKETLDYNIAVCEEKKC